MKHAQTPGPAYPAPGENPFWEDLRQLLCNCDKPFTKESGVLCVPSSKCTIVLFANPQQSPMSKPVDRESVTQGIHSAARGPAAPFPWRKTCKAIHLLVLWHGFSRGGMI